MPMRPSWKNVPMIARAPKRQSPEDEVALRQAGRGEAVLEEHAGEAVQEEHADAAAVAVAPQQRPC
eukprot:8414324-Heterocapsa_arctica.AAC.1